MEAISFLGLVIKAISAMALGTLHCLHGASSGQAIIWHHPARRRHKNFRTIRASSATQLVPFPENYNQMLIQARTATQAALDDSKKLLEIEVPPSGLMSVAGDGIGGTEWTASMKLVQQFCDELFKGEERPVTRVYLPDAKELILARESVFQGTKFKLDYLTNPSPLEDLGFRKKVDIAERVKPTDARFVVAYPSFSSNEMLAVQELYNKSTKRTGCPIIVFNGELDNIRSGYYPALFFPKLAALGRNFLPLFETVYYIYNFKDYPRGTLFRAYPGPWQIVRNLDGQMKCVYTQESKPSLKEVALEILPKLA